MWWYNTILVWHYSSTVYRYKYKYTYYRWVKTLNIIGGEGGRKQNSTVCVTIQDMIGTTLDLIRNHDQESKLSKASSVFDFGVAALRWFFRRHTDRPSQKDPDQMDQTLVFVVVLPWFGSKSVEFESATSYRYGLTQTKKQSWGLGRKKDVYVYNIYIRISTYISYFFVSHEPHTLVHRNHFRH